MNRMISEEEQLRDQLLFLRCRRGERAAWHALIALWQPRLFYYVRRLLPTEADAWDVLQQTWAGAYEGIDRVRDPGQLAPWIYRIARNKSIDFRRRLSPHETLEENADHSPAPGDEQLAFDNVESLHLALGRLSLAHREVLTLYFLEDLSVDAIAQVLGVPPGTVKSRLHHAKHELRIILEPEIEP